MTTEAMAGTAERQGSLWGARPRDWAATEARHMPTYEHAVERVGVDPGDRILDVGCGAGTFLRLAADRGARPAGLDASGSLLDVAAELVPEADLRTGDMQWLPFADDSFDLVTGFNSFFFAADTVAALAEAGRVARPGGTVLVQVWGNPQRCDLRPALEALSRVRGAGPPTGPQLWRPGVLEGIAVRAGLRPGDAFDHGHAFEYADDGELLRDMLSAGGVVEATAAVGEQRVRSAILEALAPFRRDDGGYRLNNEWHLLAATA